jgi:hypothetical protein
MGRRRFPLQANGDVLTMDKPIMLYDFQQEILQMVKGLGNSFYCQVLAGLAFVWLLP